MRPQDKIEKLVQGKTGIEDMMNKINELVDAHNGDWKNPKVQEPKESKKESKTD
jgi:hypothetical protein